MAIIKNVGDCLKTAKEADELSGKCFFVYNSCVSGRVGNATKEDVEQLKVALKKFNMNIYDFERMATHLSDRGSFLKQRVNYIKIDDVF